MIPGLNNSCTSNCQQEHSLNSLGTGEGHYLASAWPPAAQVGNFTIGYLREVEASLSGASTSAALSAQEEEEPKAEAAEASEAAEVITAAEPVPLQAPVSVFKVHVCNLIKLYKCCACSCLPPHQTHQSSLRHLSSLNITPLWSTFMSSKIFSCPVRKGVRLP